MLTAADKSMNTKFPANQNNEKCYEKLLKASSSGLHFRVEPLSRYILSTLISSRATSTLLAIPTKIEYPISCEVEARVYVQDRKSIRLCRIVSLVKDFVRATHLRNSNNLSSFW